MDESEVMTVLPKELRLGAPPTMPQARSYLYRQQSTLSTYSSEQQIQINIPRLQRSYLRKDSYLQFRLNGQYQPAPMNDVNGEIQYVPDLFLDDAGAWSLFERIEVFDYLGSTVLESIDGLPQLMSLLIDMGSDFTDPDHEGAVSHGLSSSYVATNYASQSGGYRTIATGSAIGNPGSVVAGTDDKFIFQMSSDAAPVTYTVPPTSWSGTTGIEDWRDTLQDFIDSQPALNGLKVFVNAANKFDFYHPTKTFTLTAPATNSITNKWGYGTQIAAGASLASAPDTDIVVGNMGVGKSAHVGGTPLASFGVTTETSLKDFSVQFSIPLPSFMGFLSKKMVPLHNGFSIVLTLANKFKPMFIGVKQSPSLMFHKSDPSDTTNTDQPVEVRAKNTREPFVAQTNINRPTSYGLPTTFWWQVSDVSLVCQILELGPAAESMLLSTSQGQPLILHTKQMRYYRGGVSNTAAEFSLPLNLNVASLTNLMWFMRPDGTESSLNYPSVSNRIRNFLQRWEMQYGSTILPQSNGIQAMYMAAPDTPGISPTLTQDFRNAGFTECYSELVKSRPCNPSRGRLTYTNYASVGYVGIGNFSNSGLTPFRTSNVTDGTPRADAAKFACGLNLELASGKSGDLICGLNTNGMNTQIRGYFHPSFLVSNDKVASAIDAYAEYDAFINISPGIATTVSF
jgi:hypothetical protein